MTLVPSARIGPFNVPEVAKLALKRTHQVVPRPCRPALRLPGRHRPLSLIIGVVPTPKPHGEFVTLQWAVALTVPRRFARGKAPSRPPKIRAHDPRRMRDWLLARLAAHERLVPEGWSAPLAKEVL